MTKRRGQIQKPKVLVALRDVGGTNAVLPVLRALWRDNKIQLVVIGDKFAIDILRQQNVAFRCKEDYGTDQNLSSLPEVILDTEQPALVLTGTSMRANIEREVLLTARSRGIPTIAILDHWTNYGRRFEDHTTGEQLKYLPDYLAVMDEVAKEGALQAGIPKTQIIVTGQPYFDDIVASGVMVNSDQIRETLGFRPDELMIVFASEPRGKDYGTDASYPNYLGYTEVDALELLIAALENIVRQISRQIVLVVKLHPRESPNVLEAALKQTKLKTVLIKEMSPRDLMVAADVVTGMISMFLIEAACLGKVPISIQPGRQAQDDFVGNRVGLTLPAYNLEECKSQLLGIVQDMSFVEKWLANSKGRLKLDGNSAGRVVQLVYEQLGMQE